MCTKIVIVERTKIVDRTGGVQTSNLAGHQNTELINFLNLCQAVLIFQSQLVLSRSKVITGSLGCIIHNISLIKIAPFNRTHKKVKIAVRVIRKMVWGKRNRRKSAAVRKFV